MTAASLAAAPPLSSPRDPRAASLLEVLQQRIDADLAPIAERIDRDGLYPDAALRSLGRAGLFSAHLARHSATGVADLALAVDAMAAVGRSCMATAFCTWCQDASGWYLENSDNAALRERLQGGIAKGAVLGGTGLSNPMKAFSGIEGLKLKGQRVPGGYLVSGILPWVSNLGPGHWFGTVFEDAADPAHRVMAMIQCGQPGVEIRQNARFIALEGTGTYAVLFRKALIPDEALLADPLGAMVGRIKAGFILLQTGMGLGVIQGAVDLMRAADATHGHANAWLPRRAGHFEADAAALREEIGALAATPHDPDGAYLRRVLTARLAISELALEAAQAALLHAGARGYLEGSAHHRRLREAWFVAIVTPSIRHLRQELSRMSRN